MALTAHHTSPNPLDRRQVPLLLLVHGQAAATFGVCASTAAEGRQLRHDRTAVRQMASSIYTICLASPLSHALALVLLAHAVVHTQRLSCDGKDDSLLFHLFYRCGLTSLPCQGFIEANHPDLFPAVLRMPVGVEPAAILLRLPRGLSSAPATSSATSSAPVASSSTPTAVVDAPAGPVAVASAASTAIVVASAAPALSTASTGGVIFAIHACESAY